MGTMLALGSAISHAAMIAEWNFDGQTMVDSVNPGVIHDGIYVTGGDYTTEVYSTDTPSGSGYALDLTAANTHMLVNNSANGDGYFETASFSYAMRIKTASFPAGAWSCFASKQNEGAGTGWAMRLAGAGPGTQVDFFGAGTVADAGSIDLADNQWHHAAMTYNGTTLTYYIDGSLAGSGAVSYNQGTTSWLNFGSWDTGGGRPLGGLMDDIQVYDTALTGSEVAAIAAIPEPATLGLISAVSLVGLFIRRFLVL